MTEPTEPTGPAWLGRVDIVTISARTVLAIRPGRIVAAAVTRGASGRIGLAGGGPADAVIPGVRRPGRVRLRMALSRPLLAAGLAALAIGAARAEDLPACARFAWPVARERAAFAAPDLPTRASGSPLPGDAGAARLALGPASEVALPVPSDRAATPGTFAGFVTARVATAGPYQVTLSDAAWIDVSQDGRSTLRPTAHSGQAGCPEVRKSVRFVLDAGPVTIAISRASRPRITVGLLTAE